MKNIGQIPLRARIIIGLFAAYLLILACIPLYTAFIFPLINGGGNGEPSAQEKRIEYLNCIDSYRGWGWTTNPDYAKEHCVHFLK